MGFVVDNSNKGEFLRNRMVGSGEDSVKVEAVGSSDSDSFFNKKFGPEIPKNVKIFPQSEAGSSSWGEIMK